MGRELYPSIEAMLAPGVFSGLEGRPVKVVATTPFHSVDSLSGSRFLAVATDNGRGHRYILKRISVAWDWVMRATEDDRCRAVLSWQTGLLDQMPPEIDHQVVACARDGDGWAILMRDAGEGMIPPGDDPISVEDNRRFLDSMAALNAAFWERPERADPRAGFCSLRQRYIALTPATGRRESGGPDPIPPLIVEGWELFPSLVAPDVARVIGALLEDPWPLCEALARYPQTVIHGDWKLGNLGIQRGPQPRVVLLDWGQVGAAPPAVELAWYLAVNSARLPVSKDEAIACYRDSLQRRLGLRFDEGWWRPQLELSLLGGCLQLGWPKALGAARSESEQVRARERAELEWWSAQVRAGARWL